MGIEGPTLITQLSLDKIQIELNRAADFAEDADKAIAKLEQISSTNGAGTGGIDLPVGPSVPGPELPTLDLSAAEKAAYDAALETALDSLDGLAESLTAVEDSATTGVDAMTRAEGVARSLPPLPGPAARGTRFATVIDILTPVFLVLDSVTDIQVKSTDTLAPVYAAKDQLIILAGNTTGGVYMTVPANIRTLVTPAIATINSAKLTATSAANTVFTIPTVIEGVVELLGPAVLAGNSGCTKFSEHGVTYKWGTNGSDVCYGTAGPDVFYVYAGADTVYAKAVGDYLHMGNGGDSAHGENGNDHIWGGAKHDSMWGGYGHDIMEDEHGQDADTVHGGPGTDKGSIKDGDFEDYWYGGEGDDPEPPHDEDCDLDETTGTIECVKYDYVTGTE